MIRKAVLQNHTVLDIFTASQGGTCAIIQTEYCVYTTDEPPNVTYLMAHMKNQIAALDKPLSSLGDLLGRWFGHGLSPYL